jgi:tetratricopeptide (TPR) repeat protein
MPRRTIIWATPWSKQAELQRQLDHFKQALRMTPRSASAHNNLGAALAQMGQISEAIEQLKAALRINPNYIDARNNLTKLEALHKTTPEKKERSGR